MYLRVNIVVGKINLSSREFKFVQKTAEGAEYAEEEEETESYS